MIQSINQSAESADTHKHENHTQIGKFSTQKDFACFSKKWLQCL